MMDHLDSSSDFAEETQENIAKDFRRALNARAAPEFKRITTNYDEEVSLVDNELDTISIRSVSRTVERVPLYRELPDDDGPKWRRVLYRLFPQPIRAGLMPPVTRDQWKKWLLIHLPIIGWVMNYIPKYLIGDFIAGLTIGVTHIPQSIGFALLALLPPVFGLYSSLIPVILYAFLGTSRHISVGTFPVVSLMTGNVIEMITSTRSECQIDAITSQCGVNIMNNLTAVNGSHDPCYLCDCDTLKVNIAVTLSLMVGLIMFVLGLLKLGVVSVFLSDALISGYTAAAAFTILITQIKPLAGLYENNDDNITCDFTQNDPQGYFNTPKRVISDLCMLFNGNAKLSAVITSIICFIILIFFDVINRILKKKISKIPVYIPGQLIVVVLAIGISYGADLHDNFGLPTIIDSGGILPGSCFKPTIPDHTLILAVLPEAFAIAIIGFVINIAQAKLLAQKNSYSIHPNQELLAYGVMNMGGAFFGSFPTAGALSRTVLQDATGGHTQLVSFISSFVVLLVILFLGFLFGPLPNAAVSVIVIMALKGLFLQVRDVRRYFYLHWPDMIVWLVVFISTLVIGLDIGLAIGVFCSVFIVVIQTMLPYSPELGETNAWLYPPDAKNLESYDYSEDDLKVNRLSLICIYQFNAPLYFANCKVFRSRLFIECGVNPNQFDSQTKGCFEQCYDKAKASIENKRELRRRTPNLTTGSFTPKKLEEEEEEEEVDNERRDSDSTTGMNSPTPYSPIYELTREDIKTISAPRATDYYHTVVIDCAPISFIDSMGVAMLEQVVTEFDAVDIQVLLAAPTTPVCDSLNRYGFFKRYSSMRLFPTVASAVFYAKQGNKVPVVNEPERLDKKLASNLERQLSYSARPSLLELEEVIPKGPATLYITPTPVPNESAV